MSQELLALAEQAESMFAPSGDDLLSLADQAEAMFADAEAPAQPPEDAPWTSQGMPGIRESVAPGETSQDQDPSAPDMTAPLNRAAPGFNEAMTPSERIAHLLKFQGSGSANSEYATRRLLPFVGEAPAIMRKVRAGRAIDKLNNSPADMTPTDYQLIADHLATEQANAQPRTTKQMVGDILTQLPVTAAEFLMTGPMGKAAQGLATRAIPAGVERGLATALGVSANAAARVPMWAGTAAESSVNRRMPALAEGQDGKLTYVPPKEGWTEATARGALDGFIETVSEMTGPAFSKLPGLKQLGEVLDKYMPAILKSREGAIAAAKEYAKKVGYDGIGEEFLEERFADIARSVTGNQPIEDAVPSFQQMASELIAFSIPGVAMATGGAMVNASNRRTEQNQQAARDYQSAYQGADGKTYYRDANEAVNASIDAQAQVNTPFGEPLPQAGAPITPANLIANNPQAARAIAENPSASREAFAQALGIDPAAVPLNRRARREFARTLRDQLGLQQEAAQPEAPPPTIPTTPNTEAAPVVESAPPPQESTNEEKGQGQGQPEGLLTPDILSGTPGAAETTTVAEAAPEATDDREGQAREIAANMWSFVKNRLLDFQDKENWDQNAVNALTPDERAKVRTIIDAYRSALPDQVNEKQVANLVSALDRADSQKVIGPPEATPVTQEPEVAPAPPVKAGRKKRKAKRKAARAPKAVSRNVKEVLALREKYGPLMGEIDDLDMSAGEETTSGNIETDFIPTVLQFSNTKEGKSWAREMREQLPVELRNKVTIAKAGAKRNVGNTGEDIVQQYGMDRIIQAMISSSYQGNEARAERAAQWVVKNPTSVDPADLYAAKKFIEIGANRGEKKIATKIKATVPELVSVNDFTVGDSFTIAGDEHTVEEVNDDGVVTIRDGMTLRLPEGYQLPIDEGSYKPGMVDESFDVPDEPSDVDDGPPDNANDSDSSDGGTPLWKRVSRDEVAERILKENPPIQPNPMVETIDAVAQKNTGKGYNPDHLTEERIAAGIQKGYLEKVRNKVRVTESGAAYVRSDDAAYKKRVNERADRVDQEIDRAVTEWDESLRESYERGEDVPVDLVRIYPWYKPKSETTTQGPLPDTRKGPAIGLFGQNTDAGTQYGLGLGGITPNETALERRKQDLMKRADSMYLRTKDDLNDPIRTELRRVISTFKDEPAKNARSWDNMEAALNNIEPKIKAYEVDKKGFDEAKKARASDEMVQAVADAIVQIPADKNNSIPSPERIIEQIRRMGLDIEDLYSKTTAAGRAAELQDAIDRTMKGNQLFEDEEGRDDGGGGSAIRIGSAGTMPVRVSMAGNGPPVSVDAIREWISKRFDVPIRLGRIQARKALGIYKAVTRRGPVPRVIRAIGRAYGNLGVIVHELAHHIDRVHNVRNKIPKSIKAEIATLDYDYPLRQRVTEGFAEYLRISTTLGKREAAARAPKFDAWWNKTFLAANSELAADIRDTRARIDQWARQSPENRVGTRIRDNRKPVRPAGETMKEFLGDKSSLYARSMYSNWIDKFSPAAALSKAYKESEKKRGRKVRRGDTFFEYLTANLHTAPSQAINSLEYGVHLIGPSRFGERIGKGLHQVFRENGINATNYESFRMFAYARHSVEAWSKGVDPGISIEDARYIASKYRSPEFIKAADGLTQYNNDLIDMLVDAGKLTAAEGKAIKDSWVTYIPLKRVKDSEKSAPWILNPQKLVNPATPVHRRKGADLPVLDPVLSTIERTLEFYTSAIQQQSVNHLVNELENTEGGGKFADRVPPNRKAHSFSAFETMKALEQNGVLPPGYAKSIQSADPMLAASLVSLWKPDYTTYNGAPVQRVMVNGEPVLYWFEPEMHKMVSAMDDVSLPIFLEMTLGKFTQLFKLGATGASIKFATANMLARDPMTYLMQTDQPLYDLRTWYKPAAMTAKYVKHKFFGAKPDPVLALALEHGFEAMTRASSLKDPRGYLRRGLVDRNAKQRAAGVFKDPIRTAGDALEFVREAVSWSEVGPRLAEFEYKLRVNGYTRKDLAAGKKPPRHVIIEAINAARDITTNFSRAGVSGRKVNALSVNYFNAALQSLDKAARTFKDHPVRTTIRAAGLAAISAAYWFRVKDDDWWKTAPAWLKYGHYVLNGDGETRVRIPMSYDWGTLVSGLTLALLDSFDGDDKALGEWATLAASKTIPSAFPAIITPAFEAIVGYDFFRKRWIDSESMKRLPPGDRYTPYTTGTMKALGKFTGETLGIGPARLEHFVDQLTGGMFRAVAMPAERLLAGDMPWNDNSDFPLTAAFSIRKDYSQDVDDFYEALEHAEQAKAKRKDAGEPDEDMDREASKLRKYSDMMGKIRDLTPVTEKDQAVRRERDKYIIGLSRHALGLEELESYPNPLKTRDGMPTEIRDIVDDYWSTVIYHATQSPTIEFKKGVSEQKKRERKAERRAEIRAATEELAESGLSISEQRRILRKRAKEVGASADTTSERGARLK